MNEQHHGNILGGAIGETTQTVAQLATVAATAAQTVARMRASQLETDRARDQAAADAERAVLRSEHAAARLTWNAAFERSFRTSASTAKRPTCGLRRSRGWTATRLPRRPSGGHRSASAFSTPN